MCVLNGILYTMYYVVKFLIYKKKLLSSIAVKGKLRQLSVWSVQLTQLALIILQHDRTVLKYVNWDAPNDFIYI